MIISIRERIQSTPSDGQESKKRQKLQLIPICSSIGGTKKLSEAVHYLLDCLEVI
jgi:hypothetical protein